MKRIAYPLLATILILAALWCAGCDWLKETVNEQTKETQNIDIDLTPDWVPLAAVKVGGQELTAVCFTDPTSIDSIIAVTDYADLWESIRDHMSEVNIKEFTYKLKDNHATSAGEMLLYVVEGNIPSAIQNWPGMPMVFVDPNKLSSDDRIASVPIQPGANVSDWTAVNWEGDGQARLEELLLQHDQAFRYCIDLNIAPISGSVEPTVKVMLHLNADIVFVPLD